jgi:hypothetical protein
MTGRVEVIKHVPTAEKPRLEADYRALGATSVAWTDEGGGLWTVTATFPATAAQGGAAGTTG